MAVYSFQITVHPRGVWVVGDGITQLRVNLNTAPWSVDLLTSGVRVSGRAPVAGVIAGSGADTQETWEYAYDMGATYPTGVEVVSQSYNVHFSLGVVRLRDGETWGDTVWQGAGIYRLGFSVPSVPVSYEFRPDHAEPLSAGSRVKCIGTLNQDGSVSQTDSIPGFAGLSNLSGETGVSVLLAETTDGKRELMYLRSGSSVRAGTLWSDVQSDGRGLEPGVAHTNLTFTSVAIPPRQLEALTASRVRQYVIRTTRATSATTGAAPPLNLPLADPDTMFMATEPWHDGVPVYVGSIVGARYVVADCRMYVARALVLNQKVIALDNGGWATTTTDLFRSSAAGTANFKINNGYSGPSDIWCSLESPPANSNVMAVMDVEVRSDVWLENLITANGGSGRAPRWFIASPTA